ncbi:integrase [Spirochaetia bacterium]|nr:integrase [Spirochaetia bacterium]
MGLNMKEKQAVTREYKSRYQKTRKKDKTVLLDEFIRLTGYQRKSAIRVLSPRPVREVLIYAEGKAIKLKPEKKRPANRKGKRIYTDEVIDCLRMVWTFFWYKCGKILAPLMRQQMTYIAAWAAFKITPEIRKKLINISPATIDRYLKKDKDALRLKGKSCTKPVVALKSRIPLRTFYSSEERKTPGFIQIDTVHHCAQSTSGEYILTLTATDIYSGWIFLYPLLNKAFSWTFQSLKDILRVIPFPLREFHSDNGSEFINTAVEKWCNDPLHPVPFSRSRDHQKNDNCFVEQKNGAVVREYVGYDRLSGTEEQALLTAIYVPLVPLLNFFMPTQKLKSKTRIGAKETRVYDAPRSPFARLTESAGLPQPCKNSLAAQCALYNPVELQHTVNKAILRLRQRLAQLNRIQTQEQL